MADLPAPPQPQLIRQVSERTSALDFVGLSSFRDDLVELGLQSVDDFPRFTDEDLERLGMSVVQRNIYRLLLMHAVPSTKQQPQSSAIESAPESSAAAGSSSSPFSNNQPRSRGWETTSSRRFAAPIAVDSGESVMDECPLCEEELATERQQCCGFSCCGDCFRGHLIHAEGWNSCPNPSCQVPLDAAVTAKLMADHCCVCGAGRAIGQPELRPVGCGYAHQAHDVCLEKHLCVFIERKKFPVVCPAFDVCKCPLPEATVLAILDPKASSSAVRSPSTPAISMVEVDDPSVLARATTLHKYYNLAINHAAAAHPNHKQCPNSMCAGVIDLGPLAGSRVGAGFCGVNCSSCDTTWCAACWQPAHVGLDCEEFGKVRGEWLDFVGRQGGAAAEDVAREMRNYRDMLASEEFKAANMRHCPHCGLEVFRTDGCSDVTCGRDASDKGNALHSNLGCGEHFNWDRARRYKAKVKAFVPCAAGSGDVAVRTDGVLVPPRICRLCFGAVHRGTCFEEVSAAARRIGADPFELLLYADAKLRKKRYVPAAAFDCPGVNVSVLEKILIPAAHPKGAAFRFDSKNGFKPGLSVVSHRANSGGPTSGWWGTNGDESDWETWSGRPGQGVLGIGRGSSYTGRVLDVRGDWFRFDSHTSDSAWVPIATCDGFHGYNRDCAAEQNVVTLRLAVNRILWGSVTAPDGTPHLDPVHVSQIRVHVNAPANKSKAPVTCTTSLHIDIASAIPDERIRQAVLEAVHPRPVLTKEHEIAGSGEGERVEHAKDIDDEVDGGRHRRRRYKRRNRDKRERAARNDTQPRDREINHEAVAVQQLVFKLPSTRLPKARGWAYVFTRQSALKDLRSRIGHIVGADVLLKLLESTTHVELLFRCRNGADECVLEQLEFSTCPPIPATVRALLEASTDVTALTAASDVSLLSGAAADICICWPCMRGQFANVQPEDSGVKVGDWVMLTAASTYAAGTNLLGVVTRIPSGVDATYTIRTKNSHVNLNPGMFQALVPKTQSVFAVGDVVTLATTFRSSSNLNAADGPLKKMGDTGVVIAVQPDSDDEPQPILVRAFSGQDFWYCKSALKLVSSDSVSRDSLPAIQLVQAFTNGAALDSVCRLIEPLSGEQLQSLLSNLNRSILHIPEAVFSETGIGLTNSSSNWSLEANQDAIDIVNRMTIVTQLVFRYSCKEVDSFALHSFQYLLECLDQQICLMSGPTLGITKLRKIRKVCCDTLAIAGEWVRHRQRISDALRMEHNYRDTALEFAALDFESERSSLLVKAFQCFTQVRGRCLDAGLEGFRTHQLQKSSEVDEDDHSYVNADQIPDTEFVEGHTLGVRAETIIRPGLRLFHRRDHAETEITSVSSSTFNASGRAGVYSFANMYSIFLVDRLSAYRKAKPPRKSKSTQQDRACEPGTGDAVSALPPLLRAKVNSNTVLSAAYSLWLELEIADRGENTSLSAWQDPPEGTDYDDTYDTICIDEPEEWEVLECVSVHSGPSDDEPNPSGTLPAGQTTMVYEVRGEWVRTSLTPAAWIRWWRDGLQTLARKKQRFAPRAASNMQQVPAGTFVGKLNAMVVRAAAKDLASLWLLVFKVSSRAELVSSHAVGGHVVSLGNQTSMILLPEAVSVEADHSIAFTCITSTGLRSPHIATTPASAMAELTELKQLRVEWGGRWRSATEVFKQGVHIRTVGKSELDSVVVPQVRLFGASHVGDSNINESSISKVFPRGKGLLLDAPEAFEITRGVMTTYLRWIGSLASHQANLQRRKFADVSQKLANGQEHGASNAVGGSDAGSENCIGRAAKFIRSGQVVHAIADESSHWLMDNGHRVRKSTEGRQWMWEDVYDEMWKYFDSPNRKLAVRAAVPLANGLSVFQTDWKELCVVRLSPGRDSKLNVGDSINFRTEEFGQFCEYGVLLADHVPGSANKKANPNRLIAVSNHPDGFATVQCAPSDMRGMNPSSADWQNLNHSVLSLLQAMPSLDSSRSDVPIVELVWGYAAVVQATPWLLADPNLSNANLRWLIATLDKCASPPQHVQKSELMLPWSLAAAQLRQSAEQQFLNAELVSAAFEQLEAAVQDSQQGPRMPRCYRWASINQHSAIVHEEPNPLSEALGSLSSSFFNTKTSIEGLSHHRGWIQLAPDQALQEHLAHGQSVSAERVQRKNNGWVKVDTLEEICWTHNESLPSVMSSRIVDVTKHVAVQVDKVHSALVTVEELRQAQRRDFGSKHRRLVGKATHILESLRAAKAILQFQTAFEAATNSSRRILLTNGGGGGAKNEGACEPPPAASSKEPTLMRPTFSSDARQRESKNDRPAHKQGAAPTTVSNEMVQSLSTYMPCVTTNVAIGKRAWQSTTRSPMCPASNAVDGIWASEKDLSLAVRAESDIGTWNTLFSSTQSHRGSWLHVDLGKSFDIESVVLYRRNDEHGMDSFPCTLCLVDDHRGALRLSQPAPKSPVLDFSERVKKIASAHTCISQRDVKAAQKAHPDMPHRVEVPFQGRGRHVFVSTDTARSMCLAQLQVFARIPLGASEEFDSLAENLQEQTRRALQFARPGTVAANLGMSFLLGGEGQAPYKRLCEYSDQMKAADRLVTEFALAKSSHLLSASLSEAEIAVARARPRGCSVVSTAVRERLRDAVQTATAVAHRQIDALPNLCRARSLLLRLDAAAAANDLAIAYELGIRAMVHFTKDQLGKLPKFIIFAPNERPLCERSDSRNGEDTSTNVPSMNVALANLRVALDEAVQRFNHADSVCSLRPAARANGKGTGGSSKKQRDSKPKTLQQNTDIRKARLEGLHSAVSLVAKLSLAIAHHRTPVGSEPSSCSRQNAARCVLSAIQVVRQVADRTGFLCVKDVERLANFVQGLHSEDSCGDDASDQSDDDDDSLNATLTSIETVMGELRAAAAIADLLTAVEEAKPRRVKGRQEAAKVAAERLGRALARVEVDACASSSNTFPALHLVRRLPFCGNLTVSNFQRKVELAQGHLERLSRQAEGRSSGRKNRTPRGFGKGSTKVKKKKKR